MNFAPLSITSCAPILAPIICPTPIIIPGRNKTTPFIKNIISATKLLVKLTTEVCEVDLDKLYPRNAENENAHSNPTPGPKIHHKNQMQIQK